MPFLQNESISIRYLVPLVKVEPEKIGEEGKKEGAGFNPAPQKSFQNIVILICPIILSLS
jgi:hypothetical protein